MDERPNDHNNPSQLTHDLAPGLFGTPVSLDETGVAPLEPLM